MVCVSWNLQRTPENGMVRNGDPRAVPVSDPSRFSILVNIKKQLR